MYNHAVRHCHHNISVQNAIPWIIPPDEPKLDARREQAGGVRAWGVRGRTSVGGDVRVAQSAGGRVHTLSVAP